MLTCIVQFEPPVRNSGIGGGKFLERQRVYKPESEEIYTYQVGLCSDGQFRVCLGWVAGPSHSPSS